MGISKVRPSAELGTISVSYAIRVLARGFEEEAAIAVENLLNEYNNIKEERKKDKHVLWMARANDAKHLVVAFENYDYLDVGRLNIKQESAKTWMTCKLRTPEEWVKIWKNVQAKCLKKAKEFE